MFGEFVDALSEGVGVGVRQSFFQDTGVSALSVNQYFLGCSVAHNDRHALAAVEGKNLEQLEDDFLRVEKQLKRVFCPLDKLIADGLGVVYEADLIGGRTLVYLGVRVTHHFMAEGETSPEVIKIRVVAEDSHVVDNEVCGVGLGVDGKVLEDHLVGCEGAGLICEHVVYLAQLFKNRNIIDAAPLVEGSVEEAVIEAEEDSQKALYDFDRDVEGNWN